jgi:hypothetical protein
MVSDLYAASSIAGPGHWMGAGHRGYAATDMARICALT